MAIMIPSKPVEIPVGSHEDEMFIALSKLPDDYYVFHSFMIVTNTEGKLFESETDFIIFNRNKGILCLEAKAGKVYCKKETWYYASGEEMRHGGPYRQADHNKWVLEKYFKKKNMEDIWHKCKALHAVWFPSIDKTYLKTIQLPANADESITLTKEALLNPLPDIERIFAINLPAGITTNLTDIEARRILDSVLCPSFNLVPAKTSALSIKKASFNRLLKEQINLLNFLEEQPFAVINGVAGSGKTMIAIEKARRHAEDGERVLFLCYNRQLCDFLRKTYPNDFVAYYTIDAFACSFCGTPTPDYEALEERLMSRFYEKKFPYKHIIIDEGQDFGIDRIEEASIIDLLESIVLSEAIGGSFYLFYDKNQLIQGHKIPDYISDADCKLTLYKNCRNTENIAVTSMRPLKNNPVPKMFEGSIKGESPEIFISEDIPTQINAIDRILKKYADQKIEDVVILSCGPDGKSILSPYCTNGEYKRGGRSYRVTTVRKFKGLEADAIILIDVEKNAFLDEDNLLFYVGASRARFYLDIVCSMSEYQCSQAYEKMTGIVPKNPKRKFASKLNALLSEQTASGKS